MILYPAIDIQKGECVRLRRGDFGDATVFNRDPVAQAREWQEAGAQALHVVDLDGAREGRPVNLAIVEEIARNLSIPVQYGGGIRTADTLRMVERGPVGRVIIGTSALTDQGFLLEAVKIMGDRLIVSVDAERGIITTHGWQERARVSAVVSPTCGIPRPNRKRGKVVALLFSIASTRFCADLSAILSSPASGFCFKRYKSATSCTSSSSTNSSIILSPRPSISMALRDAK